MRQGTGPFLAAGLVAAGARISGIVGTSEESVTIARTELLQESGIQCRGYTDLEYAIDTERPDAVVLCSPWQFHAEQLKAVSAAGCHCLAEKPLVWPAEAADVDKLLEGFEQQSLLLQVVAQWPRTLPSFCELHGEMPREVADFNMRLSPISIGPDMITDAAPHFISMLQALAGAGYFENIRVEKSCDQALAVIGTYRHATGQTCASLHLATSTARPRPAWYQINSKRADREVELPEYRQFLVAGNTRVELPDPMRLVAKSFLQGLAEGDKTDGDTLRQGHCNLQQLAAAWPQ